MSEVEAIKAEFNDQCITCLSSGRRMLAIGHYSGVFKLLVADFFQSLSPLEETLICWECHATLCKLSKFKNQVVRANQLLLSGQSHIYGTLSCLTTVVKTDTEPRTIYFNESNIKVKEEDLYKQSSEDDNIGTSFNCDVVDNEETPDEAFVKSEPLEVKEKEENKPVNNKWSKKRAIQNKKPKFKILKAKEVNVNLVVKKMLIYKSKDNLECVNCKLKFVDNALLMRHFKDIHDTESVCDICCSIFTDKGHLLSHLETHAERYECHLCHSVWNTKNQGQKHLIKVHANIFQCVHCELIFASRREFFKHYKVWHEKFICDYCGVTFKMRYSIKDHIRKRHSPFECKPCNKRFARYNGLWLHNKVRHSPVSQTAYCVECDKNYPDVYRYKWHLANSVKHKPKKKVRIPCPDCDKVFSKNIYMKEHYNLVHLKQYKYRCEDCDKNFIRNADLVKHRKRVHEGILPPKNKICNMCGRGFTTNEILTNHLRTHTGERPFACGSCPARFAQRTALAGHTRALHHNEKNDTSK